jgi:2-oxoglutarate ferredoxin oxidoreductase subunit alpha
VGGLEKEDISGLVSHDPANHEKMVRIREEKVQRVANFIPKQEIIGPEQGDLLVIGWGGTFGALNSAVKELQEDGKSIGLCQFNYINPLPTNTGEVFSKYKRHIVCELNLGQFAMYLRSKYPQYNYLQYNKIQGLPFFITELKHKFIEILEGK